MVPRAEFEHAYAANAWYRDQYIEEHERNVRLEDKNARLRVANAGLQAGFDRLQTECDRLKQQNSDKDVAMTRALASMDESAKALSAEINPRD